MGVLLHQPPLAQPVKGARGVEAVLGRIEDKVVVGLDGRLPLLQLRAPLVEFALGLQTAPHAGVGLGQLELVGDRARAARRSDLEAFLGVIEGIGGAVVPEREPGRRLVGPAGQVAVLRLFTPIECEIARLPGRLAEAEVVADGGQQQVEPASGDLELPLLGRLQTVVLQLADLGQALAHPGQQRGRRRRGVVAAEASDRLLYTFQAQGLERIRRGEAELGGARLQHLAELALVDGLRASALFITPDAEWSYSHSFGQLFLSETALLALAGELSRHPCPGPRPTARPTLPPHGGRSRHSYRSVQTQVAPRDRAESLSGARKPSCPA